MSCAQISTNNTVLEGAAMNRFVEDLASQLEREFGPCPARKVWQNGPDKQMKLKELKTKKEAEKVITLSANSGGKLSCFRS